MTSSFQGSAQMVKDFIMMIQEEFTLKHVNFLTSENSVEFLGRTIKRLKNGNITMEFSQKFIDELLTIFEPSHRCWAHQEAHHNSWRLMFYTMSQYQYQIDMSARHSAASSVIGQQDSTKGFMRSCASITLPWSRCSFKVHLVTRWSSSTQSRSSRSSRHSSLRRSSHHLISKVLIRWHHSQQCRSVHHQASSRHQASWSSQL